MTDTVNLPRSVVEQTLNALWATDAEEGTEAYSRELEAIKALRAALEQPKGEQEPVAWLFQHEETGLTELVDVQQVEWGFEKNNSRWQKISPVYTNPQPPRKPLTDDERQDVYAKAIKAINNDPHLPWRDAIVFETERAHGIGGEA